MLSVTIDDMCSVVYREAIAFYNSTTGTRHFFEDGLCCNCAVATLSHDTTAKLVFNESVSSKASAKR